MGTCEFKTTKIRPVCLYHRSDLDGHCSCAIYEHYMQLYHPSQDYTVRGVEYGDSNLDHLIADNALTILDWSFQPWEKFEDVLRKAASVVWIDHHKSAIDAYNAAVRRSSWCPFTAVLDTHWAACELAWRHFFPHINTPEAIHLLGRYDVWCHADPRVLPFQYRMRIEDVNAADSYNKIWKPLFDGTADIDHKVEEGALILRYQKQQDITHVRGWFPVELNNGLWQACNRLGISSLFFESIRNRAAFHGVMAFGWTGKHWRVSLYTDRDDVDCAAIATAYGGGGHTKAAGFTCDKLPFDLVSN